MTPSHHRWQLAHGERVFGGLFFKLENIACDINIQKPWTFRLKHELAAKVRIKASYKTRITTNHSSNDEVDLLCFFLSDFHEQEQIDQIHVVVEYQEGFKVSDKTGLAD